MQDSDEENFNDQEIDLVEESTDKTTKMPASFTSTTAAPSKKPKVSGSGMTAKVTIIAIYKIILGMSIWEVLKIVVLIYNVAISIIESL